MRIAILQPNYMPWRGYFDFIKQCDAFVFYDDVQYTKGDWRNRNLVKTQDGVQWMTIPVKDKGRITNNLKINEVEMGDDDWHRRHLNLLSENYRDAPYYGEVRDMLIEAFDEEKTSLSKLDILLINKIKDYLGLRCKTLIASEVGFTDLGPTERLVAICKELGATEYLSGNAAKDYLDVSKFEGINVLWHRYHEKVYPQLWSAFTSRVSIIDTLMNCGIKTRDII